MGGGRFDPARACHGDRSLDASRMLHDCTATLAPDGRSGTPASDERRGASPPAERLSAVAPSAAATPARNATRAKQRQQPAPSVAKVLPS